MTAPYRRSARLPARLRVRRRWAWTGGVGVAVVVGAVAWLAGLPTGFALAIALVAFAVVVTSTPDGEDGRWAAEEGLPPVGAAYDVEHAAQALAAGSSAPAPVVRRVRAVAAPRLARLGLDLADPADAAAIRGLLGTGPADALIASPSGARPSTRSLVAALRAVAALDQPAVGVSRTDDALDRLTGKDPT